MKLSAAEDNSGTPDRDVQKLVMLAGRLSQTVSLARALLVSGRVLNLVGIDDGIGILCAKSLDLDPVQGRAMRPHLIEMLAQIDRLAAVLRQTAPEPESRLASA